MADNQHNADIEWRDGTLPVSVRFDDPYFSPDGGLEETRHVFLGGNGLPGRFRPGFAIAELGFGTGLNMLTAWAAWRDSGVAGPLHFTSFEAFPMRADQMAQALSAFPAVAEMAAPFIDLWGRGETRMSLDGLEAEIILGDARETLPRWSGKADAWFLDGFAPAKNPELWSPDMMQAVADHTAGGGTFATYSAAGHIRRSLAEAGFVVDRVPGFGRKRHMSRGTLKGRS